MDERELRQAFARIRQGDKEAFTRVYRDMSQPVYVIAWRIVRQRETAEDITQDIFIRLFLSPPDDTVKNLRAWIFRMTRNLAIDVLRKQHFLEGTSIAETEEVSTTETGQIDMQMDVERAIARLPQRQREILTLHVNAALPFVEIARITECSLPAVYRQYQKAVRSLRESLGGHI